MHVQSIHKAEQHIEALTNSLAHAYSLHTSASTCTCTGLMVIPSGYSVLARDQKCKQECSYYFCIWMQTEMNCRHLDSRQICLVMKIRKKFYNLNGLDVVVVVIIKSSVSYNFPCPMLRIPFPFCQSTILWWTPDTPCGRSRNWIQWWMLDHTTNIAHSMATAYTCFITLHCWNFIWKMSR